MSRKDRKEVHSGSFLNSPVVEWLNKGLMAVSVVKPSAKNWGENLNSPVVEWLYKGLVSALEP
eukprot:7075008-Pyramimonas_sp.AAC.1